MRTRTLRARITHMLLIAVVPLLAMVIYLMLSIRSYSNAYDEIVSNMTIANNYNLNFREEMDESLYKLVVRGLPMPENNEETGLTNPYEILDGLRGDFITLVSITTDPESRRWLGNLLRNLDTLEDRIDDICASLENGGSYDEHIDMLENDIYILTELIQDDIQYYIYYQTESIEALKDDLNSRIYQSLIVFVVILVVIVAILLITSAIFMRSTIGPLNELVEVTGRIARGDFNARAGVRTHDEIGEVSSAVNNMAENLQIMVNKIKEDERKMRQTELRLLQEQINPHFLYNALDTIVWLIEGGKTDEAVDMVVSLSDFFKLVLSGGREYISIRDEERHIRSYLEIQQVRYRDILTYEIDIDPEIYSFRILKMTLQPLVENALYHGIKYKRAPGLVKVSGKFTDSGNILLTVEDDGVGMDAEHLALLREEIEKPCKESEKGFGMANVNERIHMNFGPAYGISLYSEPGEGTRVQIIIPAEPMERQGVELESGTVSARALPDRYS